MEIEKNEKPIENILQFLFSQNGKIQKIETVENKNIHHFLPFIF